jgi:hypothetical protein
VEYILMLYRISGCESPGHTDRNVCTDLHADTTSTESLGREIHALRARDEGSSEFQDPCREDAVAHLQHHDANDSVSRCWTNERDGMGCLRR